jgi:hypothetical protein
MSLVCYLRPKSNKVVYSLQQDLTVGPLYLCPSPAVHALTAGSGPSPRVYMGFAATPDGMLYVFGGWGSGIEGGGGGEGLALGHGVKD